MTFPAPATVSAPPPPSSVRWLVLLFTSLAMFGNYYVYDSIAPVADLLQRQLGFSDTQLGTLNAIYSLPNIFMVLIGGVLVDRFGAARVTFWTAAICLLGALATAVGGDFRVMAFGRLLFGLGAETMIVATLATIVVRRSYRRPCDGHHREPGARRFVRGTSDSTTPKQALAGRSMPRRNGHF